MGGFPKYPRSGLEYSNQTLHADRHCGGTGAGSQELRAFCIGAAWKRGEVYGFLLSFHTDDFVLALHAAAQTMYKILCQNLVTKFQTVVEKMKVIF